MLKTRLKQKNIIAFLGISGHSKTFFFFHHIFAPPPPQILSFAASYHIGVERWWVYYYKTKETIQPGVQDC
jgi:hypothetical protein